MSGSRGWVTWEAGTDGPPPASLPGLMEEGEQLLWSATALSNQFVGRGIWLSVAALIVTLVVIIFAPWGQSLSEYCTDDQVRPCAKLYFAFWQLVPLCVLLTVCFPYKTWRAKVSPWAITYAISSKRAMKIDGRKPTDVQSLVLDGTKARIDRFGTVMFGKSKAGIRLFPELGRLVAPRAVYWANEGRLRPEFRTTDLS